MSGNDALHILGLPSKFILEPAKYQTPAATQQLIFPTTLSTLINPGFAIVGVLGGYFENTRIERVFNFIDEAVSSSNVGASSGSRAVAVITEVIRLYSDNKRLTLPPYPLRPRNGIISKKPPREPRDLAEGGRLFEGDRVFEGGRLFEGDRVSEGGRSSRSNRARR